MIDKQPLFNFSSECVARLSDIVGEMNVKGKEIGLSQQEIKKVWLTIFSIFHKNNKGITKEIVSKYTKTLVE